MAWLRRLRNTFRSGRLERDIDREVAFHIRERADDLRAAGLTDREAMRRARALFGAAAGVERPLPMLPGSSPECAWATSGRGASATVQRPARARDA